MGCRALVLRKPDCDDTFFQKHDSEKCKKNGVEKKGNLLKKLVAGPQNLSPDDKNFVAGQQTFFARRGPSISVESAIFKYI